MGKVHGDHRPVTDCLLDAIGISVVGGATAFALFTHPLLVIGIVLLPLIGGIACVLSRHMHPK